MRAEKPASTGRVWRWRIVIAGLWCVGFPALAANEALSTGSTDTVQLVVQCATPGAWVYLDEKVLGRAGDPLIIPYGRDHHLMVQAPYHIPATLLLPCLLPGDPPLELPVQLAPQPAALLLTAKSPNRLRKVPFACIQLNNVDLGEVALPFETNGLPAGDLTVTMNVLGYKGPVTHHVQLEPGRRAQETFELEYDDASFVINVEPTNATVTVGGVSAAQNEFRVVPNRFYAIHISAPGFHAVTFNDAAMPGEHRALSIRLIPRTFVQFDLSPPEAVVFMQGRRLTERVVEVSAGKSYRLEVRAPGYEPYPLTITLEPGENRVVHVDLHRKGLW